MIKMSGKLLIFDKPDACNWVFHRDCKITFPDKIPVTLDFSNKLEYVLGHASVIKKSDCIVCNVELRNYIADELYIGGFYGNVKTHIEDGMSIIDEAKLLVISIISEEQSADRSLKVVLKGEENERF